MSVIVIIRFSSLTRHTCDHRVWRTGLPVRSAVLKPHAGRLVVGWVTTSESLLLYVFVFYPWFFTFKTLSNEWFIILSKSSRICLVESKTTMLIKSDISRPTNGVEGRDVRPHSNSAYQAWRIAATGTPLTNY